jgi:hypothetical protein
MLAFAWTSWYGLFVTIAAGIVTIGAAVGVISGSATRLTQIITPSKPLVSFGHPVGDKSEFTDGKLVPLLPPLPPEWIAGWVHFSKEKQARLQQEYERKKRTWEHTLAVSYVIGNKDSVPLRDLSTGVRAREGGWEQTFGESSVQILSAGETTEVTRAPVDVLLLLTHNLMHKVTNVGSTEEARAENFFYWARFERSGRRWEALYDPKTRELTYRRLRGRK